MAGLAPLRMTFLPGACLKPDLVSAPTNGTGRRGEVKDLPAGRVTSRVLSTAEETLWQRLGNSGVAVRELVAGDVDQFGEGW